MTASGKLTIFKRVGVGLAAFLGLAAASAVVLVTLRQHRTFDAPYPAIRASAEPAVIARGEYLVTGPAHCTHCHEATLSGGHEFHLPIGTIRSPNLTPDLETGIGSQSDDEIARAVRHGVAANGRALFPFMQMQTMSDDDLEAVVSYLRTVPARRNAVVGRELNALGRVVNALVIEPKGPAGPVPVSVPRAPTAEYGRYLSTSVASCVGCHTRRDLRTGAFTGPPFAGGFELHEEAATFVTPNLTPDEKTGRITTWTEDTFVYRFHLGPQLHGTPMPWAAFDRMSDDDLRAIYRFLRTLPPTPQPQG